VPTVGHETSTFSTRFSSKMVSTRNKAEANKQADAGPSGPPGIAPDLAAILDGQVKMQQELADLKKRSAKEMEALKQENSRLRRRIEADATLKGKAKETSEAVKSPAFQPTEEESEYNPTPHTFTTTQQTPLTSTHPHHFPPGQPGLTAPSTTHAPHNIPPTLHTTYIPPYNPQYLPTTHIPPYNITSTFPAMINLPPPPHIPPLTSPDAATHSQILSLTPLSRPSGNPSTWIATPAKPTPTNT